MQKIISLFKRNYDGDHLVRDEVVEGAEWVLRGEGVATRKYDGTCCRMKEGKLYKRYDLIGGKTPPLGFEPAQDPDPISGHWPGWILVGDGKEDKWFREGFARSSSFYDEPLPNGTYELVGPKVNGNPENYEFHELIPHGEDVWFHVPRSFNELREFFGLHNIEGIVWHHPDGRMVKIKKKDFGLKRK
jgi:hypothetical protein